MKKIKYIIVFILSLGIFNSCLIDNDTDLDKNADGKNFVSFEKNAATFSAIADGLENTFKIKVKLIGPTSKDITSDVKVIIDADDASTAIEGTHYRIDNHEVTLLANNNHLVEFEVTMLTAGIVTPLEYEAPSLILNVSSATGDADVIANGKQIKLTLNYACPSYLSGVYNVTHSRAAGSYSYTNETITEIGIGTYITETMGTWDHPLKPDGALVFEDVCGVVNVPLQDLYQFYGGNKTYGHKKGSVDENTGIITIYYSIEFSGVPTEYTSVYTPVK
jgi:hypothetical protein